MVDYSNIDLVGPLSVVVVDAGVRKAPFGVEVGNNSVAS